VTRSASPKPISMKPKQLCKITVRTFRKQVLSNLECSIRDLFNAMKCQFRAGFSYSRQDLCPHWYSDNTRGWSEAGLITAPST